MDGFIGSICLTLIPEIVLVVESITVEKERVVINDEIVCTVQDGKIVIRSETDNRLVSTMDLSSDPETLRKMIINAVGVSAWATTRTRDIERIANEVSKYFSRTTVEISIGHIEIKGVTSNPLLEAIDEMTFIMIGEDPYYFVDVRRREGTGYEVKYVVDIGVRSLTVKLSMNNEWRVDEVIEAIRSVVPRN